MLFNVFFFLKNLPADRYRSKGIFWRKISSYALNYLPLTTNKSCITVSFLPKSVGFSCKRITFSKPGEECCLTHHLTMLNFDLHWRSKKYASRKIWPRPHSPQKVSCTKTTSLLPSVWPHHTSSLVPYRGINWQSLFWSFTHFLLSGKFLTETQLFINDKLDPTHFKCPPHQTEHSPPIWESLSYQSLVGKRMHKQYSSIHTAMMQWPRKRI